MPETPHIQNPNGGMDKDSDPLYVKANDYVDAKNIRHISRDGQTSGSAENIYGNEYVWKAYINNQDTIGTNNKQIRVSINATSGASVEVAFKTSPNGVAIITGAPFAVVAGDIDSSLDNCVSEMDNTLSSSYGGVTEISRDIDNVNFGSVVVELGSGGTYTGIDFITTFNDTSVTVQRVVKEAVSNSLAGPTKCVGSFDLNGDLFSWWTTQDSLPDSRTVIDATNATPIVITESEAHDLVDGDEVIIRGVRTNTNANGKYIVNVTSTTEYELVGSSGNGTATISVTGASSGPNGYAVITTGTPHGLVDGDEVYIAGATGATEINGIHTVVGVYDTTNFVIDVVLVGVFAGTVTMFKTAASIHNHEGYGLIFVSEKDFSTNDWTATKLLSSKELNLVTKHQVDVEGEINSGRREFYFTDDYNVPRAFYYSGDYEEDGALLEVNPDNIYVYEEINQAATLLQVTPDVEVGVSQLPSGGAVLSGNWRYVVRFSTDNSTYGPASTPTGPINVDSSNLGEPAGIRGDAEGTTTPRVNVIEVTGIPSYFNFIELIGVYYSGGSVSSISISTTALNDSGEITLYHTGTETSSATFDISQLFLKYPDILTALNVRALDQRLVLANTTARDYPDLTDWLADVTYTVERSTLSDLGSTYPRIGYGGNALYGEYQAPENVQNRVGYLLNEKYRYAISLRYRDSDVWTPPYFLADVTFNTANGLTDYSLTTLPTPTVPPSNNSSCYPYVFYPKFSGLDFDYVLPNGKTIREEFDKIEFLRVERNEQNKTVLATGLAQLVEENTGVYYQSRVPTNTVVTGDFLTPAAVFGGLLDSRKLFYFMSPDLLLGNSTLEFESGDLIYNFGQPTYQIIRTAAGPGAGVDPASCEMYGDTDVIDGTIQSESVDGVVYNAGTDNFSLTGHTIAPTDGSPPSQYVYPGYYVSVDTDLNNNNSVVSDYGAYYVQYVRPLSDQYGDSATSSYITTNTFYDIDENSSSSDVFNVFGGDVFTQKVTLAQANGASGINYGSAFGMYSQNTTNAQMRQMGDSGSNKIALPRGNDPNDDWDTRIIEVGSSVNRETRAYDRGYNGAFLLESEIGFDSSLAQLTDYPTRMWYSETKPANSLQDNYRTILPLNYADLATSNGEIYAIEILNGELYTLQDKAFMRQYFNTRAQLQGGDDTQDIIVGSGAVFAVGGKIISTRGTRHKWSAIKGRSLNGYDTWYWIDANLKNAMKFDAGGTNSVSDIRKMKSFFANNLRWVYDQQTPADFFGICGVWNERYGEVLWTIRANATPSLLDWDASTTYEIGDAVMYGSTPLYQENFEQTGNIYVSKTGGNQNNAPTDTDNWELISHDDPRYFNEYTVAYCELRNEWESFRSFKPTIYLKWLDRFLTPRPLANTGHVYEHDRDYVGIWYRDAISEFTGTGTIDKAAGTLTVTGTLTLFTTELQSGYILFNTYVVNEIISDTEMTIYNVKLELVNGSYVPATGAIDDTINVTGYGYDPAQSETSHITPVVNIFANVNKRYSAQQILTDEAPYRVEHNAKNFGSYIEEADIVEREDAFYLTIRNNSNNTGLNNGDTGKIRGYWMKTKIILNLLIPNKIFNFVTKVVPQSRLFNK